ELEGGDGTDFFAHEPDAFLLDLGSRPLDAGLEHNEAAGDLALELVGDADHGALGDILMRGEHLLHSTGREPMAGDVNDIVGATHDVDVAVFVLEAGIRRLVIPGKLGEITLLEPLVLLPQRRQAARRERQFEDNRADLVRLNRLARIVHDVDLVAGHRHPYAALLYP